TGRLSTLVLGGSSAPKSIRWHRVHTSMRRVRRSEWFFTYPPSQADLHLVHFTRDTPPLGQIAFDHGITELSHAKLAMPSLGFAFAETPFGLPLSGAEGLCLLTK